MPKGKRTRPQDLAPMRAKFLGELRDHGIVGLAAKAIGRSRDFCYEWKKRDAAFSEAWEDAVNESTCVLEREAARRASEGVEEPVYQNGKRVGTVRKFSDVLLIFLLKARRPKVYRDNLHLSLSPDRVPKLSDEKLRELVVEAVAANVPSEEATKH